MLYHRRWIGLTGAPWERELDLRRHRHSILFDLAGMPDQDGGKANRHYLAMRWCAAVRELYIKGAANASP